MKASTQNGSDQHYFRWIVIQKYFMMRRRGQILSSWNQCNNDVSLGKIDKSFGPLFNQLKRIVFWRIFIELVKLWCINWHCSLVFWYSPFNLTEGIGEFFFYSTISSIIYSIKWFKKLFVNSIKNLSNGITYSFMLGLWWYIKNLLPVKKY